MNEISLCAVFRLERFWFWRWVSA